MQSQHLYLRIRQEQTQQSSCLTSNSHFSFHIPLTISFTLFLNHSPTMDRNALLNLLFEKDSFLLQLDTGLRAKAPRPTPQSSQVGSASQSQISIPAQSVQLQPSQRESRDQNGGSSAAQATEAVSRDIEGNTTPIPVVPIQDDKTFCPLMAVSRFPYRHIKGELSQTVARKFFDGGKFWERTWDMYELPMSVDMHRANIIQLLHPTSFPCLTPCASTRAGRPSPRVLQGNQHSLTVQFDYPSGETGNAAHFRQSQPSQPKIPGPVYQSADERPTRVADPSWLNPPLRAVWHG